MHLDEEASSVRKPTTIVWDEKSKQIVQLAADAYGVPYQTYVRYASIKLAVEDLRRYYKLFPPEE